ASRRDVSVSAGAPFLGTTSFSISWATAASPVGTLGARFSAGLAVVLRAAAAKEAEASVKETRVIATMGRTLDTLRLGQKLARVAGGVALPGWGRLSPPTPRRGHN